MNTIVIDRDEDVREALRILLQIRCPKVQLAGQAADSEIGIKLVRQIQPDLVFCEAETFAPEGEGMLEAISFANAALIIMGNSDKHATLAFELDAAAYLRKPLDAEQLVRAVEKVQIQRRLYAEYLEQEWISSALKKQELQDLYQQRFTFSNNQETFFICLKDLIRIEASNNCAYVYATECPDGVFVSKNLGEFLKALQHIPFLFQPHRSHLVNLLHIKKIVKKDGGTALVQIHSDAKETLIPVAQRYREALNLRLKELWEV